MNAAGNVTQTLETLDVKTLEPQEQKIANAMKQLLGAENAWMVYINVTQGKISELNFTPTMVHGDGLRKLREATGVAYDNETDAAGLATMKTQLLAHVGRAEQIEAQMTRSKDALKSDSLAPEERYTHLRFLVSHSREAQEFNTAGRVEDHRAFLAPESCQPDHVCTAKDLKTLVTGINAEAQELHRDKNAVVCETTEQNVDMAAANYSGMKGVLVGVVNRVSKTLRPKEHVHVYGLDEVRTDVIRGIARNNGDIVRDSQSISEGANPEPLELDGKYHQAAAAIDPHVAKMDGQYNAARAERVAAAGAKAATQNISAQTLAAASGASVPAAKIKTNEKSGAQL